MGRVSITPQVQAQANGSPARILRASAAAILALAPFGYLGILLGVALHEVVGHGLTCLALGGKFLGFRLHFDGFAYAFFSWREGGEPWRQITVLSGGVVVTSVLGLAVFACGYLCRRRAWIASPLIVVSFGLLMDGIPYVFWNSLRPVPPGDLGKIILMTGSLSLRVVLLAFGGLSMVAVVWAFTALLFAVLQGWLTGGQELQGRTRVLLLAVLGFVPGIAWFMFDWNQLVPGIGVIPNLTGLALHLGAGGSLLWLRPAVLHLRSSQGVWLAAIVGWGLAGMAVAATAIWLRHGVFFLA